MFDDSVLLDLLLAPFGHFLDPGDRLGFIYMLSALIVAIGVWIVSQAQEGRLQVAGLVRWLLPMEVLRHPSAQVDFAFFFVNRVLRAAIYGSVLFWTPQVAVLWSAGLTALFGPAGPGMEPNLWLAAALTLVTLLIMDAALWFMHYVFHVVPALWDYHKVHHSAEVMTPITAARMHPLEEIADTAVTSVVMGVVYATFTHVFGKAAVVLALFDLNVLLVLFFLAAFNLRHSHVWVRYPVWLQHILICPAQHHIHHSTARRHWDKNMGFVFAFWDWAAGTLYAPKEKETITYGLGTAEDGGTWHSLRALYFLPFRQTLDRIAPRGRKRGTDA